MGRGWATRIVLAAVALTAPGCATASGSAANQAPREAQRRPADSQAHLFAKTTSGWETVNRDTRRRIDDLARDFLEFLSHKTGRASLAELIASASRAGAVREAAAETPEAGDRVLWVDQGRALTLAIVGQSPIDSGVRVIVADVGAPYIELGTRPIATRSGVALLDTSIQPGLDLRSWLVHPLALHLYASRGGESGGDLVVAVGEGDADSTLSLPDILPHLTQPEQDKRITERPEAMDAIAGRSAAALVEELARRGVDEGTFVIAEKALLPAGRPVFVGVDRALVAGYGAGARAVAFAAVRAALDGPVPERSLVVVVVNRHPGRGDDAAELATTAVERVVSALAGRPLDTLELRQIMAASEALIAGAPAGERGRGPALSNRRDDALPGVIRRVRDRFEAGGVQVQLTTVGSWSWPARLLATSGMAVVEISAPAWRSGRPYELVSAFDLYQLVQAFSVWRSGA